MEFQIKIVRRHWIQLAEPMPKYDPEVVMEFYANAWPTEEGVMDKRSKVRGQWIPYDTDAINQFLGNPLILEEGQQCEYTKRRSQFTGFNEEAIGQLLCFPGHDFVWSIAGKRL